jgi:ATP-dependent protease ClpP protease subunit
MEFIVEGTKEKSDRVWDDYVPIVENGFNIDVYLTDYIEAPSNYNQLCNMLQDLPEFASVTLHINNGGGHVDSAFMIIDAIKNSKATVTAKLSGTIASAATIITMACDEIIATKYLSFMIHNYSTGMQGKGHELKAYQNFTDRELNKAFREIYKGFLTDEEMDKVIDGLDMWLSDEEVLERWDNRIEFNNKGN